MTAVGGRSMPTGTGQPPGGGGSTPLEPRPRPVFIAREDDSETPLFRTVADETAKVAECTSAVGHAAAVGVKGWKLSLENAHACCGDGSHVFLGLWQGLNGKTCAEYVANEDDGVYTALSQSGVHDAGGKALSNRDTMTRYSQAYLAVDAEYLLAQDEDSAVGATGVGIWCAGGTAVVSWVGNAPTFLVRNNKAIPLTCTHTPAAIDEKGRIARVGGVVTPDGYLKREAHPEQLAVARSFGMKLLKDGDEPARHLVGTEPDLTKFELTANDSMIFTCTESLLECCTTDHIIRAVAHGLKRGAPLPDVLTELLRSCIGASTHNLGIAAVVPSTLPKAPKRTGIFTSNASLYSLWTDGQVEDERLYIEAQPNPSQAFFLMPLHESDEVSDTAESNGRAGSSVGAASASSTLTSAALYNDTHRARHYIRTHTHSRAVVAAMAVVFLVWGGLDWWRGERLGASLLGVVALLCALVALPAKRPVYGPLSELLLALMAVGAMLPYDALAAWGMDFWAFSCVVLLLLAVLPSRVGTLFSVWAVVVLWVTARTVEEAHSVGLKDGLDVTHDHPYGRNLGDDWLASALFVRITVLVGTALIGWSVARVLTGMPVRLDVGVHAVASLARALQQYSDTRSPQTRFKVRDILHVAHVVDRSRFLGDALEVIAAACFAQQNSDAKHLPAESRDRRSMKLMSYDNVGLDDDEPEANIDIDSGPRASGFRSKQCTILTIVLSREWNVASYRGLHSVVMQSCDTTEGGAVLSFTGNTAILAWNTKEPCVTHSLQALSFVNTIHQNHSPYPLNMALASGEVFVGADDQPWAGTVVGKPLTMVKLLANYARTVCAKVVMTDKVYEANRSTILARPIDAVLLDGEHGERPKVVYELIRSRQGTAQIPNSIMFTRAFSMLQQLKVQKARDGFRKVVELSPGDLQARRLFNIARWLCDTDCQYCKGASYYYRRLHNELEEFSSSTFDAGHVPVQEPAHASPSNRMMSAKHDQILRKQIRDAEAEAHSDQLVAWGLMPDQGADLRDPLGKAVPKRFHDIKSRLWCRGTRCLGIGAFGEVWLGMASAGSLVAIKSMKLPTYKAASPTKLVGRRRHARRTAGFDNYGQEQVEDLLKEVSLIHKLRHENIVSYMASSVVDGYILIVMEYLSGGSLNDLLLNFGLASIPPTSIQRYVHDIARGLEFLHSRDIIHRDMKPHNVLLLVDGQCKLADFGASAGLTQLAESNQGMIGTPLYMAPEACRGEACCASDIWAVGIIICQLFTGVMPYSIIDTAHFNPHAFLDELGYGHGLHPVVPASAPSAARDVAEKCLQRDPESRPTAAKILTHEFVLT